MLETHFRFGFPNGSPIGDSLNVPDRDDDREPVVSVGAMDRIIRLARWYTHVLASFTCVEVYMYTYT